MSKILIILEGEKLDYSIITNLIREYKIDSKIEIKSYKTEIYTLYSKIKKEYGEDMENIDITTVLKNSDSTFNFKKNEFSEIYLFFDYDGHHNTATDEKIEDLLRYFNDETENGKLYINYPMVESFFHVDFSDIEKYEEKTFEIGKGYKSLNEVHLQTSLHIEILNDKEKIKLICKQNIMKTNFIVKDEYTIPEYDDYRTIDQNIIFKNQRDKFIVSKTISILNNFPNFIINYFGEKVYEKIKNEPRI